MGKRFRERRNAREPAPATNVISRRFDDEVVNHENVGTEYGPDETPYDDGTFAAYLLPGGDLFPGPVEDFNTGTNGTPYTFNPVGVIRDNIDWEIDGVSGDKDSFMYSRGVVSSDGVENFNLDGRQAIIRRMDPNMYGPVASSDHNSLVALAYAQQVNQFYPSEESQYDLIRSI